MQGKRRRKKKKALDPDGNVCKYLGVFASLYVLMSVHVHAAQGIFLACRGRGADEGKLFHPSFLISTRRWEFFLFLRSDSIRAATRDAVAFLSSSSLC